MRVSSRGNPHHDERGRFASADGAKSVVQHDKEHYEKKTRERGNKVYFGTATPLGRVLFRQSSMIHTRNRHPIMCRTQNLNAMKGVLKNPENIYRSESHENRYVYFGKSQKATFKERMYIKVIVEEKGDHLEVISAWGQEEKKGNIGEKIL